MPAPNRYTLRFFDRQGNFRCETTYGGAPAALQLNERSRDGAVGISCKLPPANGDEEGVQSLYRRAYKYPGKGQVYIYKQ